MANYSVVVAASARKELSPIPRPDSSRIASRLQSLASDPRPPRCQKLSGYGRYRLRQGDYRIIYSVDDSAQTVDIVKIGHRKEVYR